VHEPGHVGDSGAVHPVIPPVRVQAPTRFGTMSAHRSFLSVAKNLSWFSGRLEERCFVELTVSPFAFPHCDWKRSESAQHGRPVLLTLYIGGRNQEGS